MRAHRVFEADVALAECVTRGIRNWPHTGTVHEGNKFPATALLLGLLAMFVGVQPVRAWGCKGHQTVAVVAEKHLTAQAHAFADKLLSENPIDPQLRRYCGAFAGDLPADGSTWPDDVRNRGTMLLLGGTAMCLTETSGARVKLPRAAGGFYEP